jgi:hypothetical protein
LNILKYVLRFFRLYAGYVYYPPDILASVRIFPYGFVMPLLLHRRNRRFRADKQLVLTQLTD